MNTKLNSVITFVAGAFIGSLVTWKFVEKKYEQKAIEEIEAVKEFYRGQDDDTEGPDTEEYLDSESERCEEVREGVLMGGAIDIPVPQEYSNLTAKYAGKEVDRVVDRPYIIPPEEYGELDYECISLNYYADGVVADDFDEIIRDIDELIGEESLSHFGEYEDDAIFVRNDTTRCDYEILRDTRNFSELMSGDN